VTIEVEISPDLEARLAAEAEARGLTLQAYAGKILGEYAPMYATGTGILKPGDVEEMTRRLTEGAENLPVLPTEANDRESYYEDRW
jgi:hypothetical protein